MRGRSKSTSGSGAEMNPGAYMINHASWAASRSRRLEAINQTYSSALEDENSSRSIMALARQTRPEKLRLDEAIQRFEASLDPPYMTKFKALKTGPAPRPSDVFRLTEEVNRDGHKIHRTWRQYGSRLQKALDQVVVFTKVGDILMGGSQNMIACGVWAAVRLSMQIATGYLSFFDKVSSLWMNIGRSCEVREELVQLFPQSTELQTLMSEYLVVTVNFCQRIVAFAKRPFISQITSTFTFDQEFKEFETQLGHLAKLMNQRAKVLTTQATLESSKTLTRTSKLLAIGSLTARKRDYEKRRAKLLKRLCPFQDRFDRRQRHERKRGPVHWVFDREAYKAWKSDVKRRPCVLSGIIGSGKTVAAANIASALQAYEDPQSTAVAGFFCRGDDLRTLEAETIIGSLVHQLVRSLGPTAERAINRYTPENSTPSEVIDATLKALPKDRHYFLVIDALDECDTDTIIEVATKLANGAHADVVVGGAQINLTVESVAFSCLYTCRVDSPMLPMIKKLFSPIKTRSITGSDPIIQIYQISMSDPERDREIEAYITSEIAARRDIRNLSSDLEAAVTVALIAGAQGMFLWVALQLEIIFPRYHTSRTLTNSDLMMLLERLPKDLESAYDKALEHISDSQRSKQVFQLVVGCERPLTTGELAVAANVTPGDIFWDHSTFPLDPSALVWTCGGGLLEVMEEEDSVHYIHHSALRHLLLDGRESTDPASPKYAQGPPHLEHKFRLEDAGTVVAAICVTYLSYPMHDSRLAKRINVAGDRDILDAVSGSIARNQAAIASGSLTNRLISRVLDRRKQPVSQSSWTTTGIFNLVNSLARQEHQDEYETATKQFLEYASRYWLDHTRHFMDPSDLDFHPPSEVHFSPKAVVPAHCYQLLRSLVESDLAHIDHPWPEETEIARAEWALKFGHAALYNMILCIGFGHGKHTKLAIVADLNVAESLVNAIISLIRGYPESVTLNGKDLGGILALAIRFTLVKRWEGLEVDASLISDLAKFGVDLDAPMAAPDGSLWSPLCLFIRDLEWWMNGFEISSNGYVLEHKSHKMAENWSKIQTGHIKSLVSYGASPIGLRTDTMGGPRPIFMALDLHLWDIALNMLAKTSPADLDFEDECRRTLLGLAIIHSDDRTQSGEAFCVRLLEAGANPNLMTDDRAHPRESYVPLNNRVEELRRVYLSQSTFDENETLPNHKVPPLILAARLALYRIFQLLITHKANIHKTTADGQTIVQLLHDMINEGVKDVNFLDTSSRSKRYLWDYWQILARKGFVP